MLRINTPELLIFNPSLVEGLFDTIWKNYLAEQLLPEKWDAYRGDFFLDSQVLFYETFSRCIDELVCAANQRRPMDFEYVVFDYSAHLDVYNYEGGPDSTPDMDEEIEQKAFDFFHFVINKLICSHFLSAALAKLSPAWDSLTDIIGRYGIVGYWYEGIIGQMNMWEGRDHIWGIQPKDYEPLLYAPWEGVVAGTQFYHLSEGDGNDFYLYNGSIIQESMCSQIPKGEMVTLCRLTNSASVQMDL